MIVIVLGLSLVLSGCESSVGVNPTDRPQYGDRQQIEGYLEIQVLDDFAGKKSDMLSFVKTQAGDMIQLQDPDLLLGQNDMRSGDLVRLQGSSGVRAFTVRSVLLIERPPAPPLSPRPRTESVLAVPVRFTGDDDSGRFSESQLNDMLLESPNSMARFYIEASYGKYALTGAVQPMIELARSVRTACDTTMVLNEAVRVVRDRIGDEALKQYAFVQLWLPDVTSEECPAWWWAGLGTLGKVNVVTLTDGTHYQAGVTWIKDYQEADHARFISAHEIGHNLGLLHSSLHLCDYAPLGAACVSYEYGDGFDVMGSGGMVGPNHFSAIHKEMMGWLSASEEAVRNRILNVSSSGVYTISPIESGANTSALKVLKPDGQFYYLEYRQPLGFDAGFGGEDFIQTQGIQIRVVDRHGFSDSKVFRMAFVGTNPPLALSDAALITSQAFYDACSNLRFETLNVSPLGATVRVDFNFLPAPQAAAACTGSTPPPAPIVLSASIVENESGPTCDRASFRFVPSLDSIGQPTRTVFFFEDEGHDMTNTWTRETYQGAEAFEIEGCYSILRVQLAAVDDRGNMSAKSNVLTLISLPYLPQPYDLWASSVTPMSVRLQWSYDPWYAQFVDYFKVLRYEEGGIEPETVIGEVPYQTFADVTVRPLSVYHYFVIAHNALHDSPYSEELRVQTPELPMPDTEPLAPPRPLPEW
ncbi:MAG: hypothetical protein V1798_05425 [Pseudomonadota bacterium]